MALDNGSSEHSLFHWLCLFLLVHLLYHSLSCILILFLFYVRVLEGEASLGCWEPQDPPQEVALDIKLSYIYRVSQSFLSCLSPKCCSVVGQHHQVPIVKQLSTTVGSVVALVPMLQKACSPPVTASIAKEVHRQMPCWSPGNWSHSPFPPPGSLS